MSKEGLGGGGLTYEETTADEYELPNKPGALMYGEACDQKDQPEFHLSYGAEKWEKAVVDFSVEAATA